MPQISGTKLILKIHYYGGECLKMINIYYMSYVFHGCFIVFIDFRTFRDLIIIYTMSQDEDDAQLSVCGAVVSTHTLEFEKTHLKETWSKNCLQMYQNHVVTSEHIENMKTIMG